MVFAHKKNFSIRILACMLLCLMLSGNFVRLSPALAEPAADALAEHRVLDISLSVKPGEMVSPGEATLNFTIANSSDFDIQNVYLSAADGTLSEPIGQIDAGETQTLARPHTVTQEELDTGRISYIVSHDPLIDGTEKITYDVSGLVIKSDPRPHVDFTRQVSSGFIPGGSTATITYKIRNTGNVPVTAVRVRDSLGDFTGRMELLDIGESKAFISRVTVNADSVSAPELEYTQPDGTTHTSRLTASSIYLAASSLETEFSVAHSTFHANSAEAVLSLFNAGNSDYRNITVIDDIHGGVIADSIALAAGSDPIDISYTYPVRGDAQYRWRITGKSEAGETIDLTTKTVSIPAGESADSISVSIEAVPRMAKISRPGFVTFDIAIHNTGSHMAQDVLLYEVARGPVRQLAVLPTGEPTLCSVRYEVRPDSQFIFCLNYTDENGNPRTVSTAPITVEIGPGGETPELNETEELNLSGDSVKMGTTSTLLILLIAIAALLVVLVIILIITSHRIRKERKQRLAAERQRIKEEMGKTNRFTPLKYMEKNKK